MALTCSVVVTPMAYQAGASPGPVALLTVYNPNASAIVVTGIQLVYKNELGQMQRPPVAESLPPIGPGMTTSVPALSSVSFPFSLAVANLGSANSYQMVAPGAVPSNPLGAHPPQMKLFIGALVYGSDGSVNEAGAGGLLVSYTVAPPPMYQGGSAFFNGPNNSVLLAAVA